MLRLSCILCFLALFLVPYSAPAQNSVAYEIAFPNAAHHEAEIAVTVSGIPEDEPLEMRMSRTSPGRYALHEFAKNVYNVQAFDGDGEPLPVFRPNPHQWNVSGHHGTVRVTYTLFGDRADGTYTGIDNTHAHLNMPATFMFPRDAWDVPTSLTIRKPNADWSVATQLMPSSDPNVFLAPSLYYFMDSPTEIGPLTVREWTVAGGDGSTETIRLAVHHTGTKADVDRYAEMAEKVVAEQIAIYGEPPDYDGGTYTFIADYLPHADGDGMEHRNSTILASTGSLAENALGLLGTLSHEYFHQWNVERIRPRSLEPFDFEEANMSGLLWYAEGFTSYYDDLTIRRAGLTDNAQYAEGLGNLLGYVLTAPGSRYFSPVEMSMQAPFVDAASSVDPQNKQNTFISYYSWGAALGLALDLTLRTRFDTTLDAFMRTMWERYGEREQPYTLDDLEATLAEVSGDAAFADEFFDRHIYGREMPDFEALLAHAGFVLRPAHPGNAVLGADLTEQDGQVVVRNPTLVGSPAYEAGLDRGDVLLTLDGAPVQSANAVRDRVKAATPGDTFELTFEQRGERKTATVTLAEDPALEVVPFEAADRAVTDAIRAFRTAWLGSLASGE